LLDLNEVEIAHEERARSYYERLARRQGDGPAGDLFGYLALEEEGHIRRLSAVHGIPAFEAEWERKYLPYLIDLDRLAWEEGVEAEGAEGTDALRKGLLIARKAESHAIAFYGKACEVVEDQRTVGLLRTLESEERVHLAKIETYLRDL
jgi:rubrerythrin